MIGIVGRLLPDAWPKCHLLCVSGSNGALHAASGSNLRRALMSKIFFRQIWYLKQEAGNKKGLHAVIVPVWSGRVFVE